MFTQRSRNAITVTWKTRHFRLFTFEQNKVGKSEVVEKVIPVADFCRAMRCISAAYAVMRCLSVCLCVCVSVTFVSCVKTNKDIFEIFSPSGGQAILVFPSQTGWRYSDGNLLTVASNAGGVGKKTGFWTNIWLRCIQVYSVVDRTGREV